LIILIKNILMDLVIYSGERIGNFDEIVVNVGISKLIIGSYNKCVNYIKNDKIINNY
jgi:hypothetical protein